MFKVTKVDAIPKKEVARSKSDEIINLFEAFIRSEDKAVLVESDKKYASKYGLARVLHAAQKRYGYHSFEIISRETKTYLVKKDL